MQARERQRRFKEEEGKLKEDKLEGEAHIRREDRRKLKLEPRVLGDANMSG